jgi:hypothetical protein
MKDYQQTGHRWFVVGLLLSLVGGMMLVSCAAQDEAQTTGPSETSVSPTMTMDNSETLTYKFDTDGPWAEMVASRKSALSKLPRYDEFPDNATTWADYAERSFKELLIFDECWIDQPSTGIRGYRPYVKGTDQWGGASRTREITELMAGMDVLWPMYRYLQLHPDEERQAMVEAFINELPKYYNSRVEQTTNRPYETKHDSWYYLENSVLKYGHLFYISRIPALKDPYLGSLGSAIQMAHNFDYLFPQFVNLEKGQADGYNTFNYPTSGLLAYALIHAYQMTGYVPYLGIVEDALVAMRNIKDPFYLMYEPQELAAAATAASFMIEYAPLIESSIDYAHLAQDFFYAQEQMLYYDGGQIDLKNFEPQTSQWLPDTWRDGLHVPYYNPIESGGINAPAYKENFESVLFLLDYLRNMTGQSGFAAEESLKLLNLNRIKNFFFFSPNIPDEWERDYGPESLQFIPYEDIDYYAVRDHEDESVRYKAGYNGKEIYGAGETLWAYLMFEALGESLDRNTLIVNLNVLDEAYPPKIEDRQFIVFNPYDTQQTLSFTLKHLSDPFVIIVNDVELGSYQPGESFKITLDGGESALIRLANSDK